MRGTPCRTLENPLEVGAKHDGQEAHARKCMGSSCLSTSH